MKRENLERANEIVYEIADIEAIQRFIDGGTKPSNIYLRLYRGSNFTGLPEELLTPVLLQVQAHYADKIHQLERELAEL